MGAEATFEDEFSFSYTDDWTLANGTDLARLSSGDATVIVAGPMNYALVLGTGEFESDADALAFFLDRSGYTVGDSVETDALAAVEISLPRRNQTGTATLVDVENDQKAVIIALSGGDTDTSTLTTMIADSIVVPAPEVPEEEVAEEPTEEATEEGEPDAEADSEAGSEAEAGADAEAEADSEAEAGAGSDSAER